MFISFKTDPALMPYELRRRAWLHARQEARAAYDAWRDAADGDKALAYFVYRAAEEREAAAARAFGVG